MINLKRKLVAAAGAALLLVQPVYAEGLDTAKLQNWLSSYLKPLFSVLTWAIPTILGIFLLVKAITWWQAEAEGQQDKPYWVTVKKGIIVGIIAESVTLLLSVFSIG